MLFSFSTLQRFDIPRPLDLTEVCQTDVEIEKGVLIKMSKPREISGNNQRNRSAVTEKSRRVSFREVSAKKYVKQVVLTLLLSLCFMIGLVGCTGGQSAMGVTTEGSSSMEKVMGILGEVYREKADVNVSYSPTGSGAGIQAVLEKRCDIGLSSRDLKEEEKQEGLIPHPLALDAIAVVVHPDNPVSNLSQEDLTQLVTSQQSNWKQVGGADHPVIVVGREAGSGTRDGFESVLKVKGKCHYSQELTSTGDVMTSVSQNPNAIGYVSLASVDDRVKILSVEKILPSEETVLSGEYTLQRPFLLVTNKSTTLSPEAQKFMDWALSAETQSLLREAGTIPVSDATAKP